MTFCQLICRDFNRPVRNRYIACLQVAFIVLIDAGALVTISSLRALSLMP